MKVDGRGRETEESEAQGSTSSRTATTTSFGWRVLVLFGRQVTFLCSLNLFRLPFVCFYYFYVWMPLFFLALFLKYALVVLQVSSRRSSSFKRLIKHYIAFHKTIINIIRKIRRSSLSELTEWILTTIFEVVFTIFDESEESLYDMRLGDPLHFAELIGYMEMEEQHCPQQRRRDKHMRHLMHHHVPSHPFRASVRVHSQSDKGSSSGLQSSTRPSSQKPILSGMTNWLQQKRQRWLRGRGSRPGTTDSDYLGALSSNSFGFLSSRTGHMTAGTCSVSDLWSEVESVSRTSIPQSPETFARVMDRSRDRVDSVVFFVRDKLRLEERRQSHDEKCRSMASQLLSKGKFGVFDPYHTNRALELTAGLHCAGVRACRRSLQGGSGTQSSQSLVTSSPKRPQARGQGGGDGETAGGEQVMPPQDVTKVQASNGKNSANSLASVGSSGSLSNRGGLLLASPLFYSTRAAIPLMQDAFVCESVIIAEIEMCSF